jgi:hypothetical protein
MRNNRPTQSPFWRNRKIQLAILAVLLLVGGISWYYSSLSKSSSGNNILGYVRAVEQQGGSYSVTVDSADWILEDSSTEENVATTDTIGKYKISTSLYNFLQANPNYLNNPAIIYLDSEKAVTKIDLIDKP